MYDPIVIIALLVVAAVLTSDTSLLGKSERVVVFRFGQCKGVRGPGFVFLWPIMDSVVRVDLDPVTETVPVQKIVSPQRQSASVESEVTFRVIDPVKAVGEAEDFRKVVKDMAATCLRAVMTETSIGHVLSETHRRDHEDKVRAMLQDQVRDSGIEIEAVRITGVEADNSDF